MKTKPLNPELIKEIVNGNEKAFTVFHNSYSPFVLSKLRLMKLRGYTKDVFQEVFIKLWNYRAKWGMIRDLEAFVSVVCRRTALDHFKNYRLVPLEDFHPLIPITTDPDPVEWLKNSLKGYTFQERTIFLWVKAHGMTPAQTAEELGLSEQTIVNTLTKMNREIKIMLV